MCCAAGLALGSRPTIAQAAAAPVEPETTDAPAEASAPAEPAEASAFDRAQRHFAAEQWDEAVEALIEAYALDPEPDLLYARAQAERMRGNCRVAIALYERYLESNPSAAQVEDTKVNIRRCEESLFAANASTTEAAPEPATAEAPPTTPTPAKQPDTDDRPPRQPVDAVGAVLLAGAIATTATGATLWVLGARWRNSAPDAPTEDEYTDLRRRGRGSTAAGISLIGVGVALAVGAAIRYGQLAKRRRVAVTPAIAPTAWGVHAAVHF